MSPEAWPQAQALLRALRIGHPPPKAVQVLVERSCLRLLDSGMIINGAGGDLRLPPASRSTLSFTPGSAAGVDAILQAVTHEGFGPWAEAFFAALGSVFVDLTGTESQRQLVSEWTKAGLGGSFCMTDRGGPALQAWRSHWTDDGAPVLVVDKQWIMNVRPQGFGIVLVRRGAALGPAAVLVPPETWKGLNRRFHSEAFLQGRLVLADVSGMCPADPDWLMSGGGPAAAKAFLTYARPRLVRALSSHVRWLELRGRLAISPAEREVLEHLETLAEGLSIRTELTSSTEDEVMALKFLANELWLELVAGGAGLDVSDGRDLLAFTKMEGSSYRCLFEVARRNRTVKHAPA